MMEVPQTTEKINWITFFTLWGVWMIWRTSIVLQRLYFHPLSSFPGPKIAAASSTYQMYYSIWKDGEMYAQIKMLHEKYGPIVRVGPNELHFSTPEAYHKIYAPGSKLTKDPGFYALFNQDDEIFGMISPSVHKQRKSLLSPLFSRKSILGIEPLMQSKVNKFCSRLADNDRKGKASNLHYGYASLAVDIVNEFTFGKRPEVVEALDHVDFESTLVLSTRCSIDWTMWAARHCWWWKGIVARLPERLANCMCPSNYWTMITANSLGAVIDGILRDGMTDAHGKPTIIGRLLSPDISKGEAIISRQSLIQEANGFLFAGSIELSNALAYGTFRVINDPAIHQTLFQELLSVWPDPNEDIAFEVLEKLPYLTGVVKESLRLTHGAVTALPRVVPPGGVEIDGLYVPGGTVVMMSAVYLHLDESVYPSCHEFKPDRWAHKSDGGGLHKNFVPFSRGPRQCIGITMAYMELYLTFANVFRTFDMKVYDTKSDDFKWKEYMGPVFVGRALHIFAKARVDQKANISEN